MQPVMIEVAGSEKLMDTRDQPLWFKTRVHRDGMYLKAITYIVFQGETKVMRSKVDLRPIFLALKKKAMIAGDFDEADDESDPYSDDPEFSGESLSDELFSGESGDTIVGKRRRRRRKSRRTKGKRKFRFRLRMRGIGKVTRRIGKNKLIRGVSRKLKKVGKVTGKVATSKAFRGVLAGTSAVLAATGIGAPAAAALAGANVALNAVAAAKTGGKAIGKAIKKSRRGRRVSRSLSKMGKKRAAAALRKSPVARKALRDAKKARTFLTKMNTPAMRARLAKTKREADKARAMFKEIALTAKFDKNPIARDHAQKLARIIAIAATARARVKGIAEKNAGGLPGLFIDPEGNLKKGRFARTIKKAGTPGMLYRQSGTKSGNFVRKLSGEESAQYGAAKKKAAILDRRVKVMQKREELIKKYGSAKAAALKASAAYKRAKLGAKSGNTSDRKKAGAVMKRAKGKRMSSSNRKRLARGLVKRMKSKSKSRSSNVGRLRSTARRGARRANNLRKGVNTASKMAKGLGNAAKAISSLWNR